VVTRCSTETFYIFPRGRVKSISRYYRMNDLILAQVRGESVKPEVVFDHIQRLVPQGQYIEFFALKHNIRRNLVSVGNHLKSQ
jgi:N6-adenosine-specific RNA methylase IME4